ncbi:MAG: hypothetical protein QF511_00205 [Rhodospirillales bacterium]|jgi:hypothetical protein|nr:hypothetical protein [Rhodospirillales bacterium]HJP54475.1 hypothetical protein [Rhodospirillales bacterium]
MERAACSEKAVARFHSKWNRAKSPTHKRDSDLHGLAFDDLSGRRGFQVSENGFGHFLGGGSVADNFEAAAMSGFGEIGNGRNGARPGNRGPLGARQQQVNQHGHSQHCRDEHGDADYKAAS